MTKYTDAQRWSAFWNRVEISHHCWEWTGAISHDGYGQLNWAGVHLAHRASYEAFHGVIPSGMELDHLCRNRRCVRPFHLEPVTHRVNAIRGERGQATSCKQGHPFDDNNTYRNPNGNRVCRLCNSNAVKRYKQRRSGVML